MTIYRTMERSQQSHFSSTRRQWGEGNRVRVGGHLPPPDSLSSLSSVAPSYNTISEWENMFSFLESVFKLDFPLVFPCGNCNHQQKLTQTRCIFKLLRLYLTLVPEVVKLFLLVSKHIIKIVKASTNFPHQHNLYLPPCLSPLSHM